MKPKKCTPENMKLAAKLRREGVTHAEVARRLGCHEGTLGKALKKYGYVNLPPLPGIGFEGKADLYAEMTRLTN